MSVSKLKDLFEAKLSPHPHPTPPSSSRPRKRVEETHGNFVRTEPRKEVVKKLQQQPSSGTVVRRLYETEPRKEVVKELQRQPIDASRVNKGKQDENESKKRQVLLGLKEHFSSTKKPTSERYIRGNDYDGSVKKAYESKPSLKDDADFSISRSSLGTPDEAKNSPDAAVSTPISSLVKYCHSAKATLTPLRQQSEYPESALEQSLSAGTPLTSMRRPPDPSETKDEEHRTHQGTEKKSLKIMELIKKMRQRRKTVKEKEDQSELQGSSSDKNYNAAKGLRAFKGISPITLKGISTLNSLKDGAGTLMNNMVQQAQKIPATVKATMECVAKVDHLTLLAFLSLVISFTIQVYPTVPRCNSGLALLVFLHTLTKCRDNAGLLRFFLCLHVFSLLHSIDWLISDYYPLPINSNEVELWYRQEFSRVREVTRYLLFFQIVIKVVVFTIFMKSSVVGNQMLSVAWSKGKVFLPPITNGMSKQDIKDMIHSRVLALIWLEFLGSLIMLLLAVYAHARLPWAPQFLLVPTITSFLNLLYAKATCGILFVAALCRNCSRFICVASASEVVHFKVLIDQSFLRFNGTIKFFECCLGVLIWINLAYAWNLGGSVTPKEVKIVLICISVVMVFTECLASALWTTVWCYSNANDTNPAAEDEQNEDDIELSSGSSKSSDETAYHTPSTIELDDQVSCDPSKFSLKWKLLPPGFQREFTATRIPTMNECEQRLQNHRFFPVASGTINENELKMFRIARHDGVDILCELVFTSRNMQVMLHMKLNPFQSGSSSRINFLLGELPFLELFGASPVRYAGAPPLKALEKLSFSHPRREQRSK